MTLTILLLHLLFSLTLPSLIFFFFFFNDTATTEIYTLSLHDALPISGGEVQAEVNGRAINNTELEQLYQQQIQEETDRKSTRLNSSHLVISYAVFCLKKKKKKEEKDK